MSYHNESGFADGEIVPAVGFDYEGTGVFEPEPAEPERAVDNMTCLLGVIFSLGAWAGKDPLKQWAAKSVMRMEDRRPCEMARKYRVSTAYLRKLTGIARKQIGYASSEGRKIN